MAQDDNFGPKLDRRGFVRLVVAAGSAVATGGLVGCGGGGGGGVDEGVGVDEIPIGTIPEDDRAALLDAIGAFLSNNAGLTLDEQAAAALAFVRARPEFIDSDIDEDGVWAIFVDAVPLMLLFNRDPDPVPLNRLLPREQRASTEVPDSTSARLINTLGPVFADLTPRYEPLLSANGYATIVDPGSVESLRAFNNDGVYIFVGAHAGRARIPVLNASGNFISIASGQVRTRPEFGVWTSTVATRATAGPYMDDIAAGRLGIGMALHGNGQPGNRDFVRHWWFTAAFVDTYMNFGTDSLVWFNACQSHNALSANFVQACINAGAGLYVGWNRRTNGPDCLATGTFVLDRLIGSNTTSPLEVPPQRPFDYVEVWQDMAAQGLPSGLIYTAGGKFGLLAPTIAYVLINEFDDEAHLYGIFGNVASNEREVRIGGVPVTVKSWAPDKVVCKLPQSGAGSSGDVEVQVRGHKSNVRQITQWRFDVAYDWSPTELPPLSTAGILSLIFRADVGHYRDHPGVPPLEPVRWAVAKKTSEGNLGAAGTAVEPGGCTNTWSGTAQFLPGGFGNSPDLIVVARMKIDTDNQTGALGISLGGVAPPFSWTVTCPGDPPVTVPFMVSIGLLEGLRSFSTPEPSIPPITLPAFGLPFAADYTVPAHHFIDLSFSPLKIDITWAAVTPTAPPDREAAQRRLKVSKT